MTLAKALAEYYGALPNSADPLQQRAISGENNVISPSSSWSFIAAQASLQSSLLLVTASSARSEELANELISYCGRDQVWLMPGWETLPFEKIKPHPNTVVQRAKTVFQILNQNDKKLIVVAPIKSLIAPFGKEILNGKKVSLAKGETKGFTRLVVDLVEIGYERVDLVENRGEFAVRGGLIDLFPPDQPHPIRVDFFGDEIDSLYYFTVADQLRESEINNEIHLFPCKEDLIGSGYGYFSDLIGANFRTIFFDSQRLASRAIEYRNTNEEFYESNWSNLAWDQNGEISQKSIPNSFNPEIFLDFSTLVSRLEDRGAQLQEINEYSTSENGEIKLGLKTCQEFSGVFEDISQKLKELLKQGFLIALTAPGSGTLDRYRDLLRKADIAETNFTNSALDGGKINLFPSEIKAGFIDEAAKFLLLTDRDISQARRAQKDGERMPSRRKKTIDPLELKEGDYVVHEQHGVGRFIELTTRTINGVSREYLVVEYAPTKRGQAGDKLFLPTDNLDQLTKYVGGEKPSLHKIGGADWLATKKRARKAVRQIAAELIQLYAARMSAPGYAFSPDTPWQTELENAFSYVETADQLSSIEEVKRDMEKPYPMDRVVCGDVGYGKTEIAVRAAFKAVQDGKQVAVLVPTTLLVSQHFQTFTSRYEGFPVRVKALSRFNTDKDAKEVLAGLKDGVVDVVIGTHRLLSKDVVFKDLGLIIIDEEQRFGVEHKEELKKARTNVDVLSMSATPIPRTLEMAITGIREMSNITTPPEERHPVLTYVGPYNEKQIKAAINRELLREGQVFFLHNRVESIDRTATHLAELLPEARIRTAHGQMNPERLEEVIQDFWDRKFDVLVSTTIIESGIDIPNANTLIVDRADTFGLSQLHQIRGRVGRSKERAYAYFLYPSDKPLGEIAHDRLATIATHSELGSGMYVALKDLEIRGAGNLLGQEQSGHIADVGFDLYMRMVSEAVSEFKSGIIESDEVEKINCKVEIPVTAHIPTTYIESERLRLDIYRRIASCENENALAEIVNELNDRFGELPEPVLDLFEVAKIRLRLREVGASEFVVQGKFLRIAGVELPESITIKLNRIYPGSLIKPATKTVLVAIDQGPKWRQGENEREFIPWVKAVLENLFPNR